MKLNYSIPSHSILKVNLNNKIGFNISVRIPEKYSPDNLISIANSVKEEISTISKEGQVHFYLPEMPNDYGSWAVVSFNQTVAVDITGKSFDDEKIIKENINNVKDYYGLWYNNSEPGASVYKIRKDKHIGYVLESIDPKNPEPIQDSWVLKKGIKQGNVVFYDTDHAIDATYYKIQKNGDLSAYNVDGFISTYKKLKIKIN